MIIRLLLLFLISSFLLCNSHNTAYCINSSDKSEIKYNKEIVNQHLKDILSLPEYNLEKEESLFANIIKKIDKYILLFLEKIRGSLFGESGLSIGATASKILAVIVIIGFFVVILLLLLKKLNSLSEKPQQLSINSSEYLEDLKDYDSLIKNSAKYIENGNFKIAFSLVYLACISRLAQNDIIKYDPTRTNWEYIREMDTNGHAYFSEIMKPLTMLFDKKIYGLGNCVLSDYETALDVYSKLSAGYSS